MFSRISFLLIVLITTTSQVVRAEICYLCGGVASAIVRSPDVVADISGLNLPIKSATCQAVYDALLSGLVNATECSTVITSTAGLQVQRFCGCTTQSYAGTVPTTASPITTTVISPPSAVPVAAVVATPTKSPVAPVAAVVATPTISPIAPVAAIVATPTISPIAADVYVSSEPSGVPVAVPALTTDEPTTIEPTTYEPSASDDDLLQIVGSTEYPSESPSNSPSDSPSDIPTGPSEPTRSPSQRFPTAPDFRLLRGLFG